MVAFARTPFLGRPSLILPTGRYLLAPHMTYTDNSTLALTASRYYCVPYAIDRPTAFAGAWTINSGVGDNGKNIKIAMYNESTTGGPGSLAKDFGSVTLTGASAARSLASSWSASPGMYYLMLTSDSTPTMYVMSHLYAAAAGVISTPPVLTGMLGWIGAPSIGSNVQTNTPSADYVGGTYANFPEATALSLTNTINSTNSVIPIFGLYT